MDPDAIAPMIVFTTLIIVTGLVVLLRPISKRLGSYLEVLAEERRRGLTQQAPSQLDTERIARLLDATEQRLGRLEEHQEFTDKLLAERPLSITPRSTS